MNLMFALHHKKGKVYKRLPLLHVVKLKLHFLSFILKERSKPLSYLRMKEVSADFSYTFLELVFLNASCYNVKTMPTYTYLTT